MQAIVFRSILVATALAAIMAPASAVTTGNVTGSVVDCRNGARLPRAQILFREARTGAVERLTVADSKARFAALGLPEGRYLVQILAPARNGLHLVNVDPGDVATYQLAASANGDCKPFELPRPPQTTDKTTVR